jgi:hypothetical protein
MHDEGGSAVSQHQLGFVPGTKPRKGEGGGAVNVGCPKCGGNGRYLAYDASGGWDGVKVCDLCDLGDCTEQQWQAQEQRRLGGSAVWDALFERILADVKARHPELDDGTARTAAYAKYSDEKKKWKAGQAKEQGA